MDTIYADLSVSMTEFKKNPAKIVRSADKKPVAVLNHNKPAFYMLAPELFEALLQELEDRELVELARQRLAIKDDVVTVDLDEI
jgi:antitoxin StbD